MTSPAISDYLKYANLQMAAEAFLFGKNVSLPYPPGGRCYHGARKLLM